MFKKYHQELTNEGGDSGAASGDTPTNENTALDMEALMAQNKELVESNNRMQQKMGTLLDEAKTAKQKATEFAQKEKDAQLELQRQNAVTNDSLAEFETQLRESINQSNAEVISTKDAEIARLNDIVLGGEKRSTINELAALFDPRYQDGAKLMLNGMIEANHGDGNTVLSNFKDASGQLVTTSKDEFVTYMKTQPMFKSMLLGTDSSGGLDNSQQARGNVALNKKWSDMSVAEKAAHLETKSKV